MMQNTEGLKRHHLTAHFALLITCLISHSAKTESLLTDNISYKQGLSQANVMSIVQDAQGFMWFGTQDGLNRFDGYEFKVYRPDIANHHSISSNTIWALMLDSRKNLWVGTYHGLNRYDHQLDQFISYQHDPNNPQSISHNDVRSLIEDTDGSIWVATSNGLNRLDVKQGVFKRFLHDEHNNNSLGNNNINILLGGQEGSLWIGTNHGVDRYEPKSGKFIHIGDPQSTLAGAAVLALTEDQQGRLWIGTNGDGLFVYDKNSGTTLQYVYDADNKNSIASNKIKVLYQDSKARLWIGTADNGLNLLKSDEGEFIRYESDSNNPHKLSDNAIFSLYENSIGNLWIGTYSRGVYKLDSSHFTSTLVSDQTTPNNLYPQSNIRSFLVDKQGALWTGSGDEGIRISYPDGRVKIHIHDPKDPHSISNNAIFSILEDKTGTIWIGTDNGWLNRYNQKTNSFTRFYMQTKKSENIRHSRVRALFEDSAGLLWVGDDSGGLHTFDRNKEVFTHYHHDSTRPDSLASNEVFALREDRDGHIWIITFGGGLNRFDRNTRKFTTLTHNSDNKNNPSNNYIISIHIDDKEDIIWLGMAGTGLDRFDLKNNAFTNFNERDGLPNSTIYGILQDDKGALWLTSNNGLSHFNPQTRTFKNYDEGDGLQSNEFNGGAYYRAPDGKFYIGGIFGYNAFYPSQIRDNPHIPSVYITEFQLFNKPIGVNEKYNGRILLSKALPALDMLTLSYKDSVFSFKFVALDYMLPEKNQYAYKMEGLEDHWNYIGTRKFATYTTLPPGNYTLRVKAANNDGIWNEEGATLPISITPPFWQTWWFRGFVSILLILLIFGVYTFRVKSIKQRNKRLRKEVKTRTAQLEEQKTNLEITLTQLETTLSELNETKDAFEKSSKMATGVLHNVGNLLNSVNTSAHIIDDTLSKSFIQRYIKANELLKKNIDNIETFIANDLKGKKLLSYYLEIEAPILTEQAKLSENTKRLIEKVAAIKDAISAQQSSAKGLGFIEELSLEDLINDTLTMHAESMMHHDITVNKLYKPVPKIKIEKAKLTQILLNLYKNAHESMDEAKPAIKMLTIELSKDENYAFIKVSDTGVGIEPDKLKQMFTYGFTTKSDGHGFGLHSCLNYMNGIGGKISVTSDGPGKGATFILQLPLQGPSSQQHIRRKNQLK